MNMTTQMVYHILLEILYFLETSIKWTPAVFRKFFWIIVWMNWLIAFHHHLGGKTESIHWIFMLIGFS